MGQGESKNQEYVSSSSLFSEREKTNIKELFNKISRGNKAAFNFENLKQHLSHQFPEWLIDHLFKAMLSVSPDQPSKSVKVDECSLQCFTVAMAHILRGTVTQKAQVVERMASDNPAVTPQDILQWTEEMMRAYFHVACQSPSHSSWKFDASDGHGLKKIAFAVTRDLFYKAKDKLRHSDKYPENKNFDAGNLEDWMSKTAAVLHVFDVVFNDCFPVCNVEGTAAHYVSPLIPICSGVDWNKTSSVLNQFDLFLLNYHIPIELNTEWRLLFHTQAHGESFATFFKKICFKGPSILIIKDKDGHVFGGFASQSWAPGPNFVGSSRCFLFSLNPHAEIYFASGLNENFMYINASQETLPNGLSMGGQFDYYGLHIDDEFGKGVSCAEPYCTTYDSPQLSGQRKFEIDSLEVWGLGPEPIPDEEEQNEQMSILDKDPEAKAMLQIINKGPLSEGLREGDPMAEQPEQTTFHN